MLILPNRGDASGPPQRDRRVTRTRHGATAVEFAVAITVLLMLVFGGIEIARVSMLRHSVNHAAYLAARHAIIPGAKIEDAETIAHHHLNLIGVRSAVVDVTPNPITEETSMVVVNVQIPVASNSLVIPKYVSGNITGKSRLMTERAPMVMAANLPEPPPPSEEPPPPEDPPSSTDPSPPPPPPML